MAKKIAKISKNLKGTFGHAESFPDKSLSHRAIIIPSISEGVSQISNLLEGEDVMHTIDALRLAGVKIAKEGSKWLVYGKGLNSLTEPSSHLYLGNSGTSTRLLAGLFAPYDFNTFFTGDASLSKRPMGRVFKPLEEMGARFIATSKSTAPFCLKGTSNLMPIEWKMQVASAQVKSAILLASCQILGKTTIIETQKTRNHTENILASIGGEINTDCEKITINGGKPLKNQEISIPNDPSSASFLIAMGVLCEGSQITVQNVCINKTRAGFFEALKKMNAHIEFSNHRTTAGEDVADITASYSPNLTATHLKREIAPSMIDEYPILFVVASFAKGESLFEGLEELVAKESNRLLTMEENLKKMGVNCIANYENHSIKIIGNADLVPKYLEALPTKMDHRIAMSCLVAGLRGEVCIDDDSFISTSFPNFMKISKKLGCNFL